METGATIQAQRDDLRPTGEELERAKMRGEWCTEEEVKERWRKLATLRRAHGDALLAFDLVHGDTRPEDLAEAVQIVSYRRDHISVAPTDYPGYFDRALRLALDASEAGDLDGYRRHLGDALAAVTSALWEMGAGPGLDGEGDGWGAEAGRNLVQALRNAVRPADLADPESDLVRAIHAFGPYVGVNTRL